MAERRREFELSVERPTGPSGERGTVTRLTVRWEVGPGAETPSPAELRASLEELGADLDALVGAPIAAVPISRVDRELGELIEAYRPRTGELVDLLRAEGELSEGEHAVLSAHLARSRAGPAPTPVPPRAADGEPRLPYGDRPIASAPIEADRPAPDARPVPELLRTYEIGSLRQAGAVRARRQISFAEYMALKRHFEGPPAPAGPAAEPRGRRPE